MLKFLFCFPYFFQIFGTPKDYRRTKPYYDHVFAFSIVDDHIWFRNYQVGVKQTYLSSHIWYNVQTGSILIFCMTQKIIRTGWIHKFICIGQVSRLSFLNDWWITYPSMHLLSFEGTFAVSTAQFQVWRYPSLDSKVCMYRAHRSYLKVLYNTNRSKSIWHFLYLVVLLMLGS